ncbi:Acyl-CoA-binding protein, ACBP [Dillenia turbinata]|uniref:Acyl-CoA-binding protein, ACBP n=1 Tax=Dillenia turbinata TaxID=194707 RepID=A0AAN8VR95_9MAGN
MEIVQELFLTAALAIVFSLLVAKLVSMVVVGDVARRKEVNPCTVVVCELEKVESVGEESLKKIEEFVEKCCEKVVICKDGTIEVKENSVREVEGLELWEKQAMEEEAARVEEEKEERGASHVCGVVEEKDGVSGLVEGMFEGKNVDVGLDELTHERVEEDNVAAGLDSLVKERFESIECDDNERIEERNVDLGLDILDKGKVESVESNDNERLVEKNVDIGLDNLVKDRVKSVGNDENIVGQLTDENVVDGKIVVVKRKECEVEREVEGGDKAEEKEEKVGLDNFEDDWEGIERTELERIFAAAANYVDRVNKDEKLFNMGSDVLMQLYGLQKVAMEGPCHERQPLALKVSARAKCEPDVNNDKEESDVPVGPIL